jgi:hypothetical protein
MTHCLIGEAENDDSDTTRKVAPLSSFQVGKRTLNGKRHRDKVETP